MEDLSTEDKILKAAEEEFLSKGFAGARTTSIAEAAGVTHAMLHYYFRTKEKLFQKVMEEKMEMISNMMIGSIDAPGIPLFEKLENAITNHLEFIAENPALPRFFINEICADPERIAQVSEFLSENAGKVISSLQKQIDEAVSKGECRQADARMLMIDILSLNAFPFMAAPLINLLFGDEITARKDFIAERKKETIELIKRKLKP